MRMILSPPSREVAKQTAGASLRLNALAVGLLLLCFSEAVFSQEACNCPGGEKKNKGVIYLSWGYNRDWYSKSDLHFQNSGTDNYDFTLYGVSAKDRPGFDEILSTAIRGDITIPQYVYRIGYYFNNKHDIGVEINFDHSKYVMTSGQNVRVKGQIRGAELDKDTILYPDFLKFEHTDGANFMMVNFIKRKNLTRSANGKRWLSAVLKPGAGIVIPKTNVSLFGEQLDNRFHVAGWITGVETGLRYDFRHFFMEATTKGTFANYSDVLVIGTGKANHRFCTLQAILNAGFQFNL